MSSKKVEVDLGNLQKTQIFSNLSFWVVAMASFPFPLTSCTTSELYRQEELVVCRCEGEVYAVNTLFPEFLMKYLGKLVKINVGCGFF